MILKADIINLIKPLRRPKTLAAWVDLFIFNPQITKKIKLGFIALAIILMLVLGLKLFWLYVTPPSLPNLTKTNIKPLEEAQIPELYTFYKPEYQALFGGKSTASQGETSLELKLTGVITGTNPVAIIQKDKTTKMYKINDEISKHVILKSVFSNYVILNNNGKEERLSLPQILKPTAFKAKNKLVSKPKKFNWLHQEEATRNLTAEVMRADVVAELTDAANLMSMAKFYELRTVGKLQGFVLQRIRFGSLLEKAGFKNGDQILALDGMPFKDKGQVIAKLLSFHQAETATIKIRRKGETINLVINII